MRPDHGGTSSNEQPPVCAQPIRIACIGDSLTRGDGRHETWRKRSPRSLEGRGNYPMLLSSLLGASADVRNFGHGGTTACNGSNSPYQQTREYRRAIKFRPHLLVLMLGTNDAKDTHWGLGCDATTLTEGLTAIRASLGMPPSVIFEPPPILREKWAIRKTLLKVTRTVVQSYVSNSGCSAVYLGHHARALHSPSPARLFIADGVHLSVQGSNLLACSVVDALVSWRGLIQRGAEGQRCGESSRGTWDNLSCTSWIPGTWMERCHTLGWG